MNKLTEQEYVRKPDGGLAEQIEVLEAFAAGDANNTELLMLLIELRSIRAELAAIKRVQRPAGKIVSWNHPTEERKIDFMWLRFDIEPGAFLFTHPAIKMGQTPLSRHIFAVLVNELRDVPAIGCKRALIIGVLNRYGITAEPV